MRSSHIHQPGEILEPLLSCTPCLSQTPEQTFGDPVMLNPLGIPGMDCLHWLALADWGHLFSTPYSVTLY